MEDMLPAFGSDGGYQEAVPLRPAAASSGHMYAPGTLLVSHAHTTVPPKYDGIDKSKYVLWKREFLSYLFEQGCRDAVNHTPCPIRVGSEDAVESELRAIHSPERIEQAKRAWSCLNQAITNASLKQRMGHAGSPSEAWKLIEDSYAPYGTSQRKLWRHKISNIRMGHKEDPTSYLARVDNIVDTLACLGVFPPDEEVNDTIV